MFYFCPVGLIVTSRLSHNVAITRYYLEHVLLSPVSSVLITYLALHNHSLTSKYPLACKDLIEVSNATWTMYFKTGRDPHRTGGERRGGKQGTSSSGRRMVQ